MQPLGHGYRVALKVVLIAALVYLASWHVAFLLCVLLPSLNVGAPASQLWTWYWRSLPAMWRFGHQELLDAMHWVSLVFSAIALALIAGWWAYKAMRAHRLRRQGGT